MGQGRWPSRLRNGIAISTLLILAAGCTSTTQTTRSSTSSVDAPRTATAERSRARTHSVTPDASTRSQERVVRSLYLEVSGMRESALQSLQTGDPEAAAHLYDEALRRLEGSGIRPEDDDQLAGLWVAVLTEVRDLEVEALARGEDADGQPHGTTPLQSLEEIEEKIEDLDTGEPGDIQVAAQEDAPEAPRYEIPVVMNTRVQQVLSYFTGSRKAVIEAGLQRSGQYLPMMRRILKEEGVPEDLAWLPLIESGFKTSALSRAGAKGLWQFIPSTGRKYGLKIDWYVDERSDPEKATRAAAHYLRDLHGMFGDWYLALAAYNCGEGRVGRSLRRTGATDFWGLVRARAIPSETRGYVPAFLAGLTIGKDPQAHGFHIEPTDPLSYEVVHLEGPADLRVVARCAGVEPATLRKLNPELRRGVTTGGSSYALKIPSGLSEKTLAAYSQVPKDQRLLYAYHKVNRGETLSIIARNYGTSIQAIAMENGIRNPHRIAVGTSLKIPRSGSGYKAASTSSQPRAQQSSYSSRSATVHTVRRKETLSSIARRYGTTARSIQHANGLRSVNRIYPGQRLKITGATSNNAPRAQYSTYRVRTGDTLYGIARAHNTSVAALKRWNGMRGSRIHPGDKLKIRMN